MSTALVEDLKRYALGELGFDLFGIAPAEPPDSGPRFQAWLAAGRHGEMSYLGTSLAARLDPRLLLPGAQAIVCVALSYHETIQPRDLRPAADRVLVARYARRSDYHDVIRRRLLRLGAFLCERLPDTSFRVAVDTVPLLEKAAAVRAGLGWIGKNTLLVNHAFGSEILLGELVTTAALPFGESVPSQCGDCRACLDACPTRAILAPFELDARRCISYLTMEHRTLLPENLRSRIFPYLAGCDACQLPCPFNRRAVPRRDPRIAPRPELGAISMATLEGMTEDAWNRLRAGTPLRRLTYERFRRNLQALAPAGRRTTAGP